MAINGKAMPRTKITSLLLLIGYNELNKCITGIIVLPPPYRTNTKEVVVVEVVVVLVVSGA